MSDIIRACIDRVLTPEQQASAFRSPRPPSLAALNEKVWPNGAVLTCAFMDGDAAVQEKVVRYARQWEQFAHVTFDFGPSFKPAIRISFVPGGSWSYLGTDALVIPPSEATMNYGWLTPQTVDSEYSRVVLHEFGHALGMAHEQNHPEVEIPWDREAVYRYYGGPPNHWDRATTDLNVFAKHSRGETRFSTYDPMSIMHYPIPNELTLGDFEVGWNTVLSPTDKEYIGILYPRPTKPPPLTPWQVDFQRHYNDGYSECGTGTAKVGYVRGWTQRERELAR